MEDRLIVATSVCCMCGDVGFKDKLFRCNRCRHRIQHSYCGNYYSDSSEPLVFCDWCRSGENSTPKQGSSRTVAYYSSAGGETNRSEFTGGGRIKQNQREEMVNGDNSKGKSGSPRPSARRYKLLKDVMC